MDAIELTLLFSQMRQDARAIFDHALAECSIQRAFAGNVGFCDSELSIGNNTYDIREIQHIATVSVGKAGHTMAEALMGIVNMPLAGVVSCPITDARLSGLRYFFGGHPMPNEDSLQAGRAILDLLHNLPKDSLLLFLISGGASAIAESPFYNNLTLSDIVSTNRILVHSGAPIAEINAIRKHLSAIKGGRMAKAAFPARQVSLLVSDVPDKFLDALASGPTMPDSTTVDDCYRIARRYEMLQQFPERVRTVFEKKELQETPKSGDPVFAKSRFVTVLSNQTAVSAAAEWARSLGFTVYIDNDCDDWDYAQAADYLLERLHKLRQSSERVCLISGGEVTVKVGAPAGTGGRNQQFALYCAQKIAGRPVTVLSAGTDGVDGNSDAAGAVVDGSSESGARQKGFELSRALEQFDATPLLDAIGATIRTGPTGNNVRDLRILLAY
jgi:hydroxypyruvate reductase